MVTPHAYSGSNLNVVSSTDLQSDASDTAKTVIKRRSRLARAGPRSGPAHSATSQRQRSARAPCVQQRAQGVGAGEPVREPISSETQMSTADVESDALICRRRACLSPTRPPAPPFWLTYGESRELCTNHPEDRFLHRWVLEAYCGDTLRGDARKRGYQ